MLTFVSVSSVQYCVGFEVLDGGEYERGCLLCCSGGMCSSGKLVKL
jgi:hypothetical protein